MDEQRSSGAFPEREPDYLAWQHGVEDARLELEVLEIGVWNVARLRALTRNAGIGVAGVSVIGGIVAITALDGPAIAYAAVLIAAIFLFASSVVTKKNAAHDQHRTNPPPPRHLDSGEETP